MASKTVIYCVNDVEYYQRLVVYSILSLRHHSPRIPIKICVFGKVYGFLQNTLIESNVDLIQMPSTSHKMGTHLKWLALAKVRDEKTVLLVDADTLFFEPAEIILKSHYMADIYADPERGTEGNWTRGDKVIPLRIDKIGMQKLRDRFQSKRSVIPFTGLVLFNNYAAAKIVRELPVYLEVYRNFITKKIPYPCIMPIMMDEVIGSIVFGRLQNITITKFRTNTITHFNDWLESAKKQVGGFLHIGNTHMDRCFKLFGHPDEAVKLRLARQKRDQKIRARSSQKSLGNRR